LIHQFHFEAAAELEEHAAWYEERRSGLGDEFVAEVLGTLDQLTKQPTLGSIVSVAAQARRIPLASFPLSLIYLVRGDLVFLVAVAHMSRRPGYWRERI
jgi:ParE toxin of type II toxin-antitoxin system, parDE